MQKFFKCRDVSCIKSWSETVLKNSVHKNADFRYNLENKIITDKTDKETSFDLPHHLAKQCQQMLQNDSETF